MSKPTKQSNQSGKPPRRKGQTRAVSVLPSTGGRPSIRTEANADAILTLLAAGISLVTICRRADMPSYEAVESWRRDDPIFAASYGRARNDQASYLAEQTLEISDEEPRMVTDPETGVSRVDPAWVTHQRNRVDARKWFAAKMHPERYGDRQQVDLTVSAVEPMTAEQRALRLREIQERRKPVIDV